jgi:hypothetical protein
MSQPFRFLDLPSEIRIKVYILASLAPSPILLNKLDAHDFFPLPFLLTNTQIYHELRPHYYAVNSFAITLLRRNEPWDYILSPSFQDNRRQIRSLRLNIVRWGTKDYFLENLVPGLEDMIMNGRLRDLEVRTRVIEVERGLMEGRGSYGPIREALMRLLRDPYLERGVLMAGTMGSVLMPFRTPTLSYDLEGECGWEKLDGLKVEG